MKNYIKNILLGAALGLVAVFFLILVLGSIPGLWLYTTTLLSAIAGQAVVNSIQRRRGHYRNLNNDAKEVMWAVVGAIPALLISLLFIGLGIGAYLILPAMLFLSTGLIIHLK